MLRPARKVLSFSEAPNNFHEALQTFGLNWDVGLRPIWTADKNGELKVIEKYRSVNRLDTDTPLSVVSKKYCPVQHRQAADLVDEVIKGINGRFTNGGLFGGGGKVFLQAEFDSKIILKNSNEQTRKFLTFITSHDGSSPTVIGSVNQKIICLNTFKFALKEARNDICIRHTANAEQRLLEAKDILENLIDYQNKVELKINQLAATPFNDKMMNDVLRKVFNVKPEVQSLNDLPTRTVNSMNRILDFAQSGIGIDSSKRFDGWTVYNSFSQFSNHEKVVRNEKDDPFARTESLLLGSGMEFNLRAQAAIEEVAGLS